MSIERDNKINFVNGSNPVKDSELGQTNIRSLIYERIAVKFKILRK